MDIHAGNGTEHSMVSFQLNNVHKCCGALIPDGFVLTLESCIETLYCNSNQKITIVLNFGIKDRDDIVTGIAEYRKVSESSDVYLVLVSRLSLNSAPIEKNIGFIT